MLVPVLFQSSFIGNTPQRTSCFLLASLTDLELSLNAAPQWMDPDSNIQSLNTIFGFLGCGLHLAILKSMSAFQTGDILN